MKKILERLDPLLATWTVIVLGATVMLIGLYFSLLEGKNWGFFLFLSGHILGLYATRRVWKISKQLSKDREGIILTVALVLAGISAIIAILNQANTAVFVELLLASVGMFVFSLVFEKYLDQGKHASVNE